MPLIIDLKPGEKFIVNGAVVENASSNTKIRILNDCSILRQKEILADSDCVTPASRVYFALQCAYIFETHRDKHIEAFRDYLKGYAEACPSAASLCASIGQAVDDGQYYHGLRLTRDLLKHESQVLQAIQKDVQEKLRSSQSGEGK